MLIPLLKTMRPRQWLKNGFALVPLLFDGNISVERIINAMIAFGLLCLMSSAVYIMNDLSDIEEDKKHPKKKYRPLPAGELNPVVAGVAGILCAAGSFALGWLLSVPFALILLTYLVVQIAYTFWLKHVVLLDVLVVSLGFVLRIAAGATAINVREHSPWMYIFGGFLALFMILGKRRQEMVLLGDSAGKHRKVLNEYNLDLVDRLLGIVTTSAIVSYSLYTFLSSNTEGNPLMMFSIPFVIYGLFRYMYLIHVRGEGGAPEEVLLRDRSMQINLILWGIVVTAALYIPNIFPNLIN